LNTRGWVINLIQSSTGREALREISSAFERRRHILLLQRSTGKLIGELFRSEQEQPLLVCIKVLRNINGAAETPARDVVSILRPYGAGEIVEVTVGVQIFVTMRPPAGAVELLRA